MDKEKEYYECLNYFKENRTIGVSIYSSNDKYVLLDILLRQGLLNMKGINNYVPLEINELSFVKKYGRRLNYSDDSDMNQISTLANHRNIMENQVFTTKEGMQYIFNYEQKKMSEKQDKINIRVMILTAVALIVSIFQASTSIYVSYTDKHISGFTFVIYMFVLILAMFFVFVLGVKLIMNK